MVVSYMFYMKYVILIIELSMSILKCTENHTSFLIGWLIGV